jgi:hypothetical protein
MSRTPQKHSKKSTALRIPVTHGLKDMYAMDMHAAYQAACTGKFNVTAFSRLAAAISVVLSALEQHQTKIPQAIDTLNTAVEVLLVVRARGDKTEVWELQVDELPIVLNGINMAEQCIGTLDVALLEKTAAMLLKKLYGDAPPANVSRI